jgi:hypothetical protein
MQDPVWLIKPRETPIARDVNGVMIVGRFSYDPECDLLNVRSFYGKKSTQLGGSRPESLAGLLLRELHSDRCGAPSTRAGLYNR